MQNPRGESIHFDIECQDKYNSQLTANWPFPSLFTLKEQ